MISPSNDRLCKRKVSALCSVSDDDEEEDLQGIPPHDRQLFVGNLPRGMKDSRKLQKFFNKKLQEELGVCCTSEEDNHPVALLGSRITWPFAFLDFSTAELATQCLHHFNNVHCEGSKLEVQRPKNWTEGILFLGNLTPDMTENRLREFICSTMKYTGLLQCSSSSSFGKSPIDLIQRHDKHAFITFSSARDAAQALHLNQVPFLGKELIMRRKAGWNQQEEESVKNWKSVLSRHTASLLPFDDAAVSDDEISLVLRDLPSARRSYTEQVLVDFLGSAMQQVGLNVYQGNPVIHFEKYRKNKTMGFLKLRSAQEATLALRLNGIPFEGHVLQINRLSKWNGPSERIWNWKNVLRDFFATGTTDELGEVASSPRTMENIMRSRESALQQQEKIEKLELQIEEVEQHLGQEEDVQDELADVLQQLECKCAELTVSQNELQRTKAKLEETQQRETEVSNREGILELKFEEGEEKYKKMADRMSDAMGELLEHQGTFRAMQKEMDSERKKREQADATINKLKDDLEAALKDNSRRTSENQNGFLQVKDFYE